MSDEPSSREIRLRKRNHRDIRTLLLLLLASACYLAAAGAWGDFRQFLWVVGLVGSVLGLYVCAHPARHFIDILLYRKIEGERFFSVRATVGWIALNGVVMLGGWVVIVIGVMKLTAGVHR
jgi:hypothetical protein